MYSFVVYYIVYIHYCILYSCIVFLGNLLITYVLYKSPPRPTQHREAWQVPCLARAEAEDASKTYCCYLGFDNQYGQSSRFENKYQPSDVTFIFHSVSALQLLE